MLFTMIYILMPVHNRIAITRNVINCLGSQKISDFHLVLIDDGSVDNTAEMVQASLPHVSVIRGTGNWWWAGSLQQGYLWLIRNKVDKNSTIVILNDDTEFDGDFLSNGLAYLQSNRRTLLQAQCYASDRTEIIDRGTFVDWGKFSFDWNINSEKINCLSTRGLFIRFEDFIGIGGFYTTLLPHYLSDYEFTIRAYRKGMKLVTVPEVRLYLNKETTGHHIIDTTSLGGVLYSLFSIKSANNLIFWSVFILMACPPRWIVLNLLRVYYNAFKKFSASVQNR